MKLTKSEELALFTTSERAAPKYTVYQALESARGRVAQKRRGAFKLNAASVGGRPDNERITLMELNRISESVFQDTMDDLRRGG